jgi:predicted ATPase with chaperone activity
VVPETWTRLTSLSPVPGRGLQPVPLTCQRPLAVAKTGLSQLADASFQDTLHPILKPCCTIADLVGSHQINIAHLAEAIQYRPWRQV